MSATISTNCVVYTATAAAAGPTKLFLLGRITYPYASASSPLGTDGICDEVWNGTSWALTNVIDSDTGFTLSFASSCYDPTTKRVYMFGDWDGTGASRIFDTVANNYIAITTLRGSLGGNATFAACYGTTCFIFAGMNNGAGGFSTAIQSYPINVGTPVQSYTTTSATMPTASKDIFGVIDPANPQYVYCGGGSTDTTDPPTNSTAVTQWVRYDMSTPNTAPTAMTSIPVGLALAACCCLNGVIYVIGGCVTGTPNTKGTTTVRTYTIATNTWATLGTAYPIPVAGARATVFNGVIYCGDGTNASGFDINANPPNSTNLVYKSSDAGASWQLHSTTTYKAASCSILVAQ